MILLHRDLSSENLRWLSSEQALADLASFRVAMAKTHGLEHAKWVTFGGSYPGSLSAWFRLKYPQYVDVAVSSSAPLQAVVDFSGALQTERKDSFFFQHVFVLSCLQPGC